MAKLNVVLFSAYGRVVGSAVLDVGEFPTLGGGVIWKNRHFQAVVRYGQQSDPLQLVEVSPAPIILQDDQVIEP